MHEIGISFAIDAVLPSIYIGCRLVEIVNNIESITWSFRDGQAVVEREQAWNTTNANHDAPHDVDASLTFSFAKCQCLNRLQVAPEACHDNQGHHRGGELPKALHRENSPNHSPSPSSIRKP